MTAGLAQSVSSVVEGQLAHSTALEADVAEERVFAGRFDRVGKID